MFRPYPTQDIPMRIRLLALPTLALALVGASALADDKPLNAGDPAPPFAVAKFLKGETVKSLEQDQIYVVEFWATWCGPCRASIPHITDLAKKYDDQVTFIGVSVWENDPSEIEPFVKEMGDKMGYNVAVDLVPEGKKADEGAMAAKWLTAAGENGIPSAFIIGKDQKIAWIGHPMEMDKPLAEIVEGKFDTVAFAKERLEQKEAELKLARRMETLRDALRSDDKAAAVKLVEQYISEEPTLEAQLGPLKFNLLFQSKQYEAGMAYGKKLTEGLFKDNAQGLNLVAWTILDPDGAIPEKSRDLDLALAAAKKASELTDDENFAILDTYALALFHKGDVKKALDLQEKAIKLAGDEAEASMKERLEKYKKAVEKP